MKIDRYQPTDAERQQILDRSNGICYVCEEKIIDGESSGSPH
jgi:hypothetical protein